MRFLYCGECRNLRPRGLFIWTRRCEMCGGDMIKIDVSLTKIAPLYYSSIIIAMALVALYFSDYDIPFGIWLIILIGIIVMILAFLDFSISYDEAKEKIKNMKKIEEMS